MTADQPEDADRDRNRVTRGTATTLAMQTVARAAGFGFLALATRSLGPESFARYSVASALVLLANYITDFGTTPTIIRAVSGERGGPTRSCATRSSCRWASDWRATPASSPTRSSAIRVARGVSTC